MVGKNGKQYCASIKKIVHQDISLDGIKRKFATLHRKKIPTGDPLMPQEVRRAKHIRYKIVEGADLGEGNDDTTDDFLTTVRKMVSTHLVQMMSELK